MSPLKAEMDDVGGSEGDEHPLSDEPTAVSARLEQEKTMNESMVPKVKTPTWNGMGGAQSKPGSRDLRVLWSREPWKP